MEMFYLILKLNYASLVVPEKYPKDQCEKIAKEFKYEAFCLAAPQGLNNNSQFYPYPGYYCGSHDCKLLKE